MPRAAQFKSPELSLDRSRERAFLVSEQLALHQLRRQARTIDFQEWRVAPRTDFMNGARKVILARSTFSGD